MSSPNRRALEFPADRLRQLLLERDWSTEEFARRIRSASKFDEKTQDVHLRTVRNWLDGTHAPTMTKLNVFLRVFGFYTEDELYGRADPAQRNRSHELSDSTFNPGPDESSLEESTYYRYRTLPVPLIDSPELIAHLESRYECEAFRLGDRAFPVTVVWRNEDQTIDPESVLGALDKTPPTPLPESPLLDADDYAAAREFIRSRFEAPPCPIQYEGAVYRMTSIDLSGDAPKVGGAFGLYYDNILTQYAMEWELRKALLPGKTSSVAALRKPGALPLREAVERLGNPITNGVGRCAALTISTLLVFKRRNGEFYCLLRRRSLNVGVSPSMLHVVPAGMFEAKNGQDDWSIVMNVWRELLEEVYNEAEQHGSGHAELPDHIWQRPPIRLLGELLRCGSAELSVTGICCDLLNLRPEICTVLFLADSSFCEERPMVLNWEYEAEGPAGLFAVRWNRIDEVIEEVGREGMVASGAVCLGLGRNWVRQRYGM